MAHQAMRTATHARDTEHGEDEIVGQREQPLDQREPAIQLTRPRVRVRHRDLNGLVLVGRRIFVAQQTQVGRDTHAEPGQGQVPVSYHHRGYFCRKTSIRSGGKNRRAPPPTAAP